MSGYPHLQAAIGRLFQLWLREASEQVAEHLAQNGDGLCPQDVTGACPLTFGKTAVAGWAMEQNGDPHNEGG